MKINLTDCALAIGPGNKTVLDLSTLIRAHLYDLSVLRDIRVAEFEPRLVQPLSDGLIAAGTTRLREHGARRPWTPPAWGPTICGSLSASGRSPLRAVGRRARCTDWANGTSGEGPRDGMNRTAIQGKKPQPSHGMTRLTLSRTRTMDTDIYCIESQAGDPLQCVHPSQSTPSHA
jgi:hypothetical protein